jgi:hypothetical protein
MRWMAFALVLAACTSTSPSPADLQPQIFLDAFNSQLRVNVGLSGKADHEVSAAFRGTTVVGAPLDLGTGSSFFGEGYLLLFELDHPIAGDEPASIDIDGIAMTITAPPPFDGVQLPASISRSQPGTISWTTTSPDAMRWMVEDSQCAFGYGSLAADAASLTFAPMDLMPIEGADPNATCATTVRLYRARTGILDPAFEDASKHESGSLIFEQYDDVTFSSTP